MNDLNVFFLKPSFKREEEISRRHANRIKKHIDNFIAGREGYDSHIVLQLYNFGINVSDVFEYDPRILAYAFENLSPIGEKSTLLFPYVMQCLFLAERGKGPLATKYQEKLPSIDLHALKEPKYFGFLEQPIPEICEILLSDDVLFQNSVGYYRSKSFYGYNAIAGYAESSKKGLPVLEYLLKVSTYETNLNIGVLKRSLCKLAAPKSSKVMSYYAKTEKTLLPYTEDIQFKVLFNWYRTLRGAELLPWQGQEKKAFACMEGLIKHRDIQPNDARLLLINMGLGDHISQSFKKQSLVADLGL